MIQVGGPFPGSDSSPRTNLSTGISRWKIFSALGGTPIRDGTMWRRAGASIALHRLRGLGWSHDIIEPARPPARQALATLIGIIESDHAGADHEHDVDPAQPNQGPE